MKVKKVLTANLKKGMISAEAAYTSTNHLVIDAKTELTDEIIEKLKYYAVKSLRIVVEEGETTPTPVADPTPAPASTNANPTYFERVQQSQEFREFESQFSDCINDFKNSLNDIVTKSSDGLVDNMLNNVSALLGKTRNPLHLLDMMQCMRGYDDQTYAHSMNVALICNVIGKWLHMEQDELNILTTCGLLHDIGKLKIPAEIITKPGKLTDEEYNIVKNHPMYGFEILQSKNLDERVKISALQHHERYNGKGYPLGISKDGIAYFSSIVAIADVYDAMTANRVYRKGICPFTVIEEFERSKENYEPRTLYLFMERTIEAYMNTEVLLSNGQKGRVVLLNKTVLSRPIILTDDQQTIDLSKQPDIKIESLL